MCRWSSVASHPSNAEWADPYKPRFRSRLQQKSDDKSWQNGPNPDEAMVLGTPPSRFGPLMRVRIRLFSKIQDFASWLPKIARLLQFSKFRDLPLQDHADPAKYTLTMYYRLVLIRRLITADLTADHVCLGILRLGET